jgi:Lar family restriction alleviation protein
MAEIKLKPCPFCGCKAEIKRYVGFAFEQAYVVCTNCEARTKMIDPSLKYCANDKAAELWNKREEAKSGSLEGGENE